MAKCVNTIWPEQNGRHFADDIFKKHFLEWKVWYLNFKFHWSLFCNGLSANTCQATTCSNDHQILRSHTVYPKKYAHGFCFAVLCCGYTLTDFPISIRLTSLALWQSNDCPSASKATLMNMDKYFMWIHYERLHNHNKAKHNKTVCIFLGIYCTPSLDYGGQTDNGHVDDCSCDNCQANKR